MVDIPEGTSFDGFWTLKKPIHHYVLFAEAANPREASQANMKLGNIVFTISNVQTTEKAAGLEDITKYARQVVGQNEARLVLPPATPFDIPVNEQCWLVLQLDNRVNWQFFPNGRACTAKHRDDGDPEFRTGFNVCLRHVDDDGNVTITSPGDNCRLIFFGVVHRAGKTDQAGRNGHHYFNLNIEFVQDLLGEHGGRTILPLSIDPDVPNLGDDPFPPP